MKTEQSKNNRTRAYIFDYGGTLDTGGHHWWRVIWQAYEDVGVPVDEAAFRNAYVAVEQRLGRETLVGSDDTFRQTLTLKLHLQLQWLGCDAGWGSMLLERLYAEAKTHTRHSGNVLRQLSARMPLVLVSNFYGNLSVVLREMGLDGVFQCVVESAVVGVRKPDPRIFRLALEALGLQPAEVTIVGDSLKNDICPALLLGCPAVWLRGHQWEEPSATFNHVGSAATPSQPYRIINDLNELL